MRVLEICIWCISLLLMGCGSSGKRECTMHDFSGKEGEVRLMVLAPGHFHASLLQKNKIPQINDSVYVYAPQGAELDQYLASIDAYNNCMENPTQWKEVVYAGDDFLKRMISDKKGNVVVLAGNNKDKTRYIFESVNAGFHVLSDKPMAINKETFHLLEQAFDSARIHNVLLYDMMTERYDVLNMIERRLMQDKDLFGELQTGSENDPAVFMESVHHFYKEVSGKPLIRPAWYYDVEQQGEGIADVTTHLIDQVNWKCFPEATIDYRRDIGDISATRWPTVLTLSDYTRSTGLESFPDYLNKYVKDSRLHVFANGTIHYQVKGVHVALKVVWNYQAPPEGGDTFTAYAKGSKAVLRTIQDKAHRFVKQLYIEKAEDADVSVFNAALLQAITEIQRVYPQVSAKPLPGKSGEYLIDIPLEVREPHEIHFGYVAQKFFDYLVDKNLPEWENSNTLAKYFITTTALEKAIELFR